MKKKLSQKKKWTGKAGMDVKIVKQPQCSRMRKLPETILFSSIAPGGMSIRSP